MEYSKKNILIILFLILALVAGEKAYQYSLAHLFIKGGDDPYHTRQYSEANIILLKQKDKKVVVIGDSIAYGWELPKKVNGYILVNRGINGDTTDALIGRFTNDVIKIKPQYVVILAGINDLAIMYEADPSGADLQVHKIVSNIRLMAENALVNGTAPIVCSVLPVNEKYRLPVQDINNIVMRLNKELESMTKLEGMMYVDFWSIVIDQNTGGLKTDYSNDGIHPNAQAYQQMGNLLFPRLE